MHYAVEKLLAWISFSALSDIDIRVACVRATSFARVREHVFSDFLAIRLSILVDGHAIVVLDVDLKLERLKPLKGGQESNVYRRLMLVGKSLTGCTSNMIV